MKTAEDSLREVNDNVMKLNDKDISKSNQIIEFLKTDVVNAMKQSDPLFNVLYREIYFSGSYYDDLKIGKPDEFDLNFVIDKSPFKDVTKLVEGSAGDKFNVEILHPEKNLPLHNVLHRKEVMTRFMNLLHPTMDMKGVPRKNRTFNLEPNKVR